MKADWRAEDQEGDQGTAGSGTLKNGPTCRPMTVLGALLIVTCGVSLHVDRRRGDDTPRYPGIWLWGSFLHMTQFEGCVNYLGRIPFVNFGTGNCIAKLRLKQSKLIKGQLTKYTFKRKIPFDRGSTTTTTSKLAPSSLALIFMTLTNETQDEDFRLCQKA